MNASSYRLVEALAAGAVPVILADGWALPFAERLDYRDFAVVWREGVVQDGAEAKRQLREVGLTNSPFILSLLSVVTCLPACLLACLARGGRGPAVRDAAERAAGVPGALLHPAAPAGHHARHRRRAGGGWVGVAGGGPGPGPGAGRQRAVGQGMQRAEEHRPSTELPPDRSPVGGPQGRGRAGARGRTRGNTDSRQRQQPAALPVGQPAASAVR